MLNMGSSEIPKWLRDFIIETEENLNTTHTCKNLLLEVTDGQCDNIDTSKCSDAYIKCIGYMKATKKKPPKEKMENWLSDND